MPKVPPCELTSLPDAYKAWRASELGRITDRIEERLVLQLAGGVAGKRVLDVGCGDGVLAVHLTEAGGIVTGLDSDPAMLAAARQRASATTTFVDGDARSLPSANSSFDVVAAVTVLCFVADAEQAVKEMARVLRPGGHIVIGELGRTSLWAAKRRLTGWLGSQTWRKAHFRTAGQLRRLALAANLKVSDVDGASSAIQSMKAKGLLAVEMEAAALYAFAQARTKPVVCFAHVTNQMAQTTGDFEKGEADGSIDALVVISAAAMAWSRSSPQLRLARRRAMRRKNAQTAG